MTLTLLEKQMYLAVTILGLSSVAGAANAQVSASSTVRHIVGVVVDSAGNPVADVDVTLAGNGTSTRSGSSGAFRIAGLTGEAVTLQFRRIGYQPLDSTFRFGGGDSLGVRIVLRHAAAVLPTTVVTATGNKPERYAGTTKYDDFFYRREKLNGIYLMREEIERAPSGRVADVIGSLPGMRSKSVEPGLLTIYSIRCERIPFALFVDGVRQPSIDMLSTYQGSELEGIEVYRSRSELPAAARASGVCGAVFLWTRDRK